MKHHNVIIDALNAHNSSDKQWFLDFAKECLDAADRIAKADAELALLYLGHAADAVSRASQAIRLSRAEDL